MIKVKVIKPGKDGRPSKVLYEDDFEHYDDAEFWGAGFIEKGYYVEIHFDDGTVEDL